MRRARAKKRKVRILVADRGGVFRIGLKKILSVEDDLRVVAQAEEAAQVEFLAKKFKPEVLFVQAEIVSELPGDLLPRVRRAAPGSRVVVTAMALGEDEAERFVKAGASGVILKTVDPSLFAKCVRKVLEGEVWLPKRQVAKMAGLEAAGPEQALRPADTLTRREKAIVSCLIQGWRNREIAQHLSITEQTVKNHLRTIYDKVGVSDRLELALYAIHQRLELPPVDAAAIKR